MTVIPLIVALLVVGVVGGADAARAGGLATKAVLWFVGFYIFSAVFGAVMTPALLALWPLAGRLGRGAPGGLAGVDQSATQARSRPSATSSRRSSRPTRSPPPPTTRSCRWSSSPPSSPLPWPGSSRARAAACSASSRVWRRHAAVIGWVLCAGADRRVRARLRGRRGAGGSALGAVFHYVLILSALGVILTGVGFGIAILVARFAPGPSSGPSPGRRRWRCRPGRRSPRFRPCCRPRPTCASGSAMPTWSCRLPWRCSGRPGRR
jgi:proton glutamate symport protein